MWMLAATTGMRRSELQAAARRPPHLRDAGPGRGAQHQDAQRADRPRRRDGHGEDLHPQVARDGSVDGRRDGSADRATGGSAPSPSRCLRAPTSTPLPTANCLSRPGRVHKLAPGDNVQPTGTSAAVTINGIFTHLEDRTRGSGALLAGVRSWVCLHGLEVCEVVAAPRCGDHGHQWTTRGTADRAGQGSGQPDPRRPPPGCIPARVGAQPLAAARMRRVTTPGWLIIAT